MTIEMTAAMSIPIMITAIMSPKVAASLLSFSRIVLSSTASFRFNAPFSSFDSRYSFL